MVARFELLRDGSFDMGNMLYPRIEIEVPNIEYVKNLLKLLPRKERSIIFTVLVNGEYID